MKVRTAVFALLSLSFAITTHAQEKKFLAEIFANINCQNCRVPDDQFNTFLAAHPDIQILNIHNSNTDQSDPFYVGANPSADTRDKFYGGGVGLNDPVAFINGYFGGSGKDQEPAWEKNYQLSSALPLITVTKSVGSDEKITLTFTPVATNPSKVFVALKESKIIFHNTEAYGTMPNDTWNDMFRTMLPSPSGSANFVGSKSFTVTYDPSVNSDWNVDNMDAIVLVQEVQESDATHSHPIESMGIIALGSAGSGVNDVAHTTDHLLLASNPTRSLSHIGVALSQSAPARIEMFDMMGRSVQTFADQALPEGTTNIQIEGRPIPSGCYLLQLVVSGRIADQQKLIVE